MSLSSVIGALRANLSLDSSQFQSGSKKAQSSVKGLQGTFAKAMPAITKLVVGLGAAFAGAMGASIAGAAVLASNAKEIERSATSLGVAASEYQALTGAAAKFGIEGDKVKDVLKDTGERVGELVATGGGGLADWFELIGKPSGMKAEDLLNLPPVERLVKIQSMMEDMNIPLEQQSFLWESIAGDATYFIPLLKNGGAELNRIRTEMEKTGQILSDSVIKNLSTFSSNLSGVQNIMAGWGNILVSGFAPQLAELSTRFLTFITNSQAIRSAFAAAGQAIGAVLSFLNTNFDRLVTYAATAAAGVAAWGAMAGIAAIATGGLAGALGVLRVALIATGIGAVIVIAGELVYQFSRLVTATGGFGAAMIALKAIAIEVWDRIIQGASSIGSSFQSAWLGMSASFNYALHDMLAAFSSFIGKVNAAINATFQTALPTSGVFQNSLTALNQAGNDAMVSSNKAATASTTAWTAATAPLKSIKSLLDAVKTSGVGAKGTPTNAPVLPVIPTTPVGDGGAGGGGGGGKEKVDKFADTVKRLNEELEKYKATVGMTKLEEEIWSAQREAGALGNASQSKVIDNIMKQTDALERQKEAGKKLEDTLASTFTSIVNGSETAASALSSLLSSMASNLFSAGMSSLFKGIGGSGFGGDFLATALGTAGANANGTAGWRGGLSWVGERGPELVNLNQGSKVYSHQKSMNMISGSNGGNSKIEIALGDGLVANIIGEAKQNSIAITKQGIGQYDKAVPSKINKYNNGKRAR